MLWRSGYTTRVERRTSAPRPGGTNLSGEAWSGVRFCASVLSARDLPALELWRRLFRERYPDTSAAFIVLDPAADLSDLVPPSAYRDYGTEPLMSSWTELHDGLESNHPVAIAFGNPHLLLFGPPTEDAWEECWSVLDSPAKSAQES